MLTPLEEPPRPRENDSPQRLAELSDLAKGEAIAGGLSHLMGRTFRATVESVRYGGVFDRQHGFRRPAEIRVGVSSEAEADCAGIREVTDLAIESALAASLGKAAGERYRIGLVQKQYGHSVASPGGLRLMIQVARA